MKIKKFKSQILNAGGGGMFVFIPFNVEKEFGKKNMIPVKATFDGEPYKGIISNMGKGPILIVLKAIREKIKKGEGDIVSVTVEHDTSPRTIEIPQDVKTIFSKNKEEKKYFDSLAYTHRREFIKWITDAKRIETRTTRIEKMLKLLTEKKKNPTDK